MAPARRTRKKQRVQTDSDLSSEDEDFKPKAAKQVRRVRGKRGGLAKLPTMPLDVIFEVRVKTRFPRQNRDDSRKLIDFGPSASLGPFESRKNVEGLSQHPDAA